MRVTLDIGREEMPLPVYWMFNIQALFSSVILATVSISYFLNQTTSPSAEDIIDYAPLA